MTRPAAQRASRDSTAADGENLAAFESSRPRLRRLAQRLLRDAQDAEDAVQDMWLKLSAQEPGHIRDIDAWLTTATVRSCIDRLRARRAGSQHEPHGVNGHLADSERATSDEDPERAALRIDAIGTAMLVILNQLQPLERVAFVLHDLFELPFDEIAELLNRSPAAARQLASRARRRIRLPATAATKVAEHRRLAEAFLSASQHGDFAALLNILHPHATLIPDERAAALGPGSVVTGAKNVARFFSGRAAAAYLASINGQVGLIVAPGDTLLLVLVPTFSAGRIVSIEAVADPLALAGLELRLLGSG